tara:strand:+ start:435 stop:560 length:126 start_codon:yes stop_codon:yes gene_type:complete
MEIIDQIKWNEVFEILKAIFGFAIIIVLGYLGRNFVKRYPK